jgi:hypothetical protein
MEEIDLLGVDTIAKNRHEDECRPDGQSDTLSVLTLCGTRSVFIATRSHINPTAVGMIPDQQKDLTTATDIAQLRWWGVWLLKLRGLRWCRRHA